jgi:hypothetical protein
MKSVEFQTPRCRDWSRRGHRVRDNAGDVGHAVVAEVEQGAVVFRAPELAFEVVVVVSDSLDLALQLLRLRLLDALPARVSLV